VRALALVAAAWLTGAQAAVAQSEAWTALRSGQAVLLLRHASAPGTGDPANFVLEDCSTQRNLSEQGRAEAQRWGELLRRQGITSARLLSSRWCRALATARQLNLGQVEPLPLLDSFYAGTGDRNLQTAALRRFLEAPSADGPVVLVSHQVNITALTGVFPRSGEGLILRVPITDPVQVLARIAPPGLD
jgi:broad specificity phosphatase PhoE